MQIMKNILPLLFVSFIGKFYSQNVNSEKQTYFSDNIPAAVFEENKGQVKDQFWNPRPDVLYYGNSGGMNYFIKNNGISYQLSRIESWKEDTEPMQLGKEVKKMPDSISTYRIDAEWLNSNPNFEVVKGIEFEDYNNYYNVSDGIDPTLFVKKYANISLQNIWDGIDIHYYSSNSFLETDYIVAPGADYKKIQIHYQGGVLSKDAVGNLIIKTPFGEIREGTLKVYQNNKQIEAFWKISEDNVVSFEIPNYNADIALVIDPLTRVWGTYYGGSGTDDGGDVAVDANGNVYLCGQTSSTSSISSGGFQNTWVGGFYDAFVVKFNNAGIRLWATYYGGSGWDYGKATIVDGSGNVYLAGETGSSIGIASGGHQNTFGGSNNDCFLVKFNSSGIRLWGTYYGGSNSDIAMGTAVDASGNVYLTGVTNSTNAIASGGHQNLLGGSTDAFLVKFNSSGTRLWATYYGGSGADFGGGNITVDLSGNIYLAGNTASTSAIASGGHQNFSGGGDDAFLVKFNSSGTRLWGTYYGGISQDGGGSVGCDASGNVFLVGSTYSPTAISSNGHQNSLGGDQDAFLVKFNSSGQRIWGTYYGGSGVDSGRNISINNSGNIFIVGQTNSTTAISNLGFQNIHGGVEDLFVVSFNSSGVRQWATYYGGINYEYGGWIVNDLNGNIFVAGSTSSSASIASVGHQNTIGGGQDAFLVKFSEQANCTSSITSLGATSICAGSSLLLNANTGTNLTYQWQLNGLNVSGATSSTFSAFSSGTYTVVVIDGAGCIATSNAITVTILPVPNVNAGNDISVCAGTPVTLNASGAIVYSWDQGVTNGISFLPSLGTLIYTVTGTSSNGCSDSDQVTIQVLPSPNLQLDILGGQDTICNNGLILANGADQYIWQDGSQLNYLEVNQTGTYSVNAITANGCQVTDSINIWINNSSDTILYVSAIGQFTLNGVTYYQTAVYTQVLTNSLGCDSTILLDLDLSFSSIPDQEEMFFTVFPNPTNDFLHIDCSMKTDLPFSISDCFDRKVVQGQTKAFEQIIDINEFTPGLYYLKILGKSVKIIKL